MEPKTKEPKKQICIKVTEKEKDIIDELAEMLNTYKSEVIRYAVMEMYQNRKKQQENT